MNYFKLTLLICVISVSSALFHSSSTPPASTKKSKCTSQPTAPKKVEKLIKECEDDVKIRLVKEAFSVLRSEWHDDSSTYLHHRYKRYDHNDDIKYDHHDYFSHPTTVSHGDRHIAGVSIEQSC